ncbi:MAG: GTPase HflX [Chloroflexi bacterium]|nr:GTPase HflX [Chloroflexota bacterium]
MEDWCTEGRRAIAREPEPTGAPEERALLVGVELYEPGVTLSNVEWPVADSLAELERLAETAGLVVVGHLTQRLERPNSATFIGAGKVAELSDAVEESAANVVLFDDELSPRHQRELERILGERVKVLDRTALILDIFAQHARTREGALQVELAQYEYRLPRLTRAWTHLARQAGGRAGGATGGVGVRGPGETQLETDRRVINRRIARIRRELEGVREHRGRHRARRRLTGVPTVAIVGYTNAGKSTLLNRLADASVLAVDQLFATLDPTTRRISLPGGGEVLFTDTVGFIQKLPTQLVAAFRATLEEVTEADLLMHVVDVTHPQMVRQAAAVFETLEELGAAGRPMVTALNKIDRLQDAAVALADWSHFVNRVSISALTGEGIDELLARIAQALEAQMVWVDVVIPYRHGELVADFHRRGLVEREEYVQEGTHITGRVPTALAGRLGVETGDPIEVDISD